MQLLNLPPGTVRSFVLDNDPVPRAMLSVDPTFAMLKQSAPMSWVLEARRAFLGSNVSFTPEKFLYENVGDVRLRSWPFMPFHNPCSSTVHSLELSVKRGWTGSVSCRRGDVVSRTGM